MAVTRRPRWRLLLSIAILGAIASSVVAKDVAQLSVPEIEDAIQVGIFVLCYSQPGAVKHNELHRLTMPRDAL